MQAMNIRRSIIRLAGIVALATGLLTASGIAGAEQVKVGLTECNQDTCAVVTIDDLKAAQAKREIAVYRPVSFPADRFSPHFVP